MKFISNYTRIYIYIFLVLATFICFIAPDVIYGIFNPTFSFKLDYIFILAFVPFAMILPLVYPRFIAYIILVVFMIMELIQFSHIFYFGAPLSPFALSLIWSERYEILESSSVVFPDALIHIFGVCLPYILLIFLYARFARFGVKKGILASILAIFILSILPYKALYKTPKIANFMPKNDAVSIYNSLSTFSGYIFVTLKNGAPTPSKYAPYVVEKLDNPTNQNIIIILGESLNAKHLSLLGYTRKTTPILESIASSSPNFYATQALSSSVLTRNSMNMFFNITYEHDNILHIANSPSHLMYLAKQNGFKTFYLSNQTIAELSALSPKYVDVAITKEDNLAKSEELGDKILLELLDSHLEEFKSGKNFIVLHQRSSHSPYESTYRAYDKAGVYPIVDVDLDSYKLNSYDNSVIFNDFIIGSIYKKFDSIKELNPSVVMFFPDHGEASGVDINGVKNKIWGHAILDPSVAYIPFVIDAYGYDRAKFIDEIRQISYPTHYEIGKFIARRLGFDVHSLGEKENIFYLNGLDIDGRGGYYEIHKRDGQVEFIRKD